MHAWIRVAALAGLGRWAEVERLLPLARATVEGIELSTYRYRYESVAARLAASMGDIEEAQRLIAKTREQLARMGYAFQQALILADLALAAWTIGLGDLALAMAREADAAAEAARSPLGRLRAGAALSLTLPDGSERDRRIASTLELSSREGLASLWAAGDPVTLAPILAHALRAGLGPPGATRQVITARADPLLSACAPLLIDAPAAARAELAAAAGEATSGDPAIVEGLLRDPDESVRRAARAGRGRLRAARPPLRLGGLGGFSVLRGDVPIPAPPSDPTERDDCSARSSAPAGRCRGPRWRSGSGRTHPPSEHGAGSRTRCEGCGARSSRRSRMRPRSRWLWRPTPTCPSAFARMTNGT